MITIFQEIDYKSLTLLHTILITTQPKSIYQQFELHTLLIFDYYDHH